jgi:hypothetical protein
VLRYRRTAEAIRDMGYRLPRIILTEIGWEGALVGIGHRGFRMWADQGPYLDWLKWYGGKIMGDPRVEYASIFETGAQQDWLEMDAVGSQIDGGLADYARSSYSTPAPGIDWARVEATIGQEAQRHIIPLNPSAAFEKAGVRLEVLPAGPEFDMAVDSVTFRAQAYREAGQREWQYIVYAKVDDWGTLRWFRRAN